jgi:hypothetical protein
VGKPRNAEEQAFWDAAAIALVQRLAVLGATGKVDDYGPKEVAGDAYEFATALLAERQRMTDASP